MPRKPSPLSPFSRLSDEEKDALWEFLRENSYEAGAQYCADYFQFSTSASSVERFYRRYTLSRSYRETESMIEFAIEQAKENGEFSPEQLEAMGDAMFIADAMAAKDGKTYIAMRRLRQSVKKDENEERRIDLLEQKYEDSKEAKKVLERVKTDDSLTEEQLRQIAEDALQIL